MLAFETVPCVTEVVALCTLLQSRPAARAWLSLACRSAAAWVSVDGACSHVLAVNRCRSAAELQSGERLVDAVDAIEQYDISGQVKGVERVVEVGMAGGGDGGGDGDVEGGGGDGDVDGGGAVSESVGLSECDTPPSTEAGRTRTLRTRHRAVHIYCRAAPVV